MPFPDFDFATLPLETPAFVYDERALLANLESLFVLSQQSGCRVLYSVKAFALADALRLITTVLHGFSASSVFEAVLARRVLTGSGSVHVTSPCLTSRDVDELAEVCDYVSFNSLSQWTKLSDRASRQISCGIRINPGLSFVADARYDPCRKHSKLGASMRFLSEHVKDNRSQFRNLKGIHLHTNCDSLSFEPLLVTVKTIEAALGDLLTSLEWINLGGGYLYDQISRFEAFHEAVEQLTRQYELQVFVEPGEAVVGNIGYIVSSVVDIFESDGKSIAILDTTINHVPAVFAYQQRLPVLGSNSAGTYAYLLAGATCLAGDLFGEYRFENSLEIGSKIVFGAVGAYSLTKANMFNGINLPSIYSINPNQQVHLKKQYSVQDFISQWES